MKQRHQKERIQEHKLHPTQQRKWLKDTASSLKHASQTMIISKYYKVNLLVLEHTFAVPSFLQQKQQGGKLAGKDCKKN